MVHTPHKQGQGPKKCGKCHTSLPAQASKEKDIRPKSEESTGSEDSSSWQYSKGGKGKWDSSKRHQEWRGSGGDTKVAKLLEEQAALQKIIDTFAGGRDAASRKHVANAKTSLMTVRHSITETKPWEEQVNVLKQALERKESKRASISAELNATQSAYDLICEESRDLEAKIEEINCKWQQMWTTTWAKSYGSQV